MKRHDWSFTRSWSNLPCYICVVLKYGLQLKDLNQIWAADIWFLLHVKQCSKNNYVRTQWQLLEKISSDTKRQVLGIFFLNQTIKAYEWNRKYKLQDVDRLPKQILYYVLKGKRDLWKPHKRWFDAGDWNRC